MSFKTKLSYNDYKKLYFRDSGQSGTDNVVLEFNMSVLSALLKKQSEQNPSASYFNVDILKYQVCGIHACLCKA